MPAYRMLGLLIATAMALLLAPAAAQAAPYPAEPPASSVSAGTVIDGGFVVFSGQGFLPFERISINISYNGSDSTASLTESSGGFVLAALPERRAAITVTATAEGTFSIRIQLDQLGDAVLVATGLTSGVTVAQNVSVLDPPPRLPVTGGDGEDGAGGPPRLPITGGDGEDGTDSAARLPVTGSDGGVLTYTLYGGLGAILIGAGAIFLTRARRRSTRL